MKIGTPRNNPLYGTLGHFTFLFQEFMILSCGVGMLECNLFQINICYSS